MFWLSDVIFRSYVIPAPSSAQRGVRSMFEEHLNGISGYISCLTVSVHNCRRALRGMHDDSLASGGGNCQAMTPPLQRYRTLHQKCGEGCHMHGRDWISKHSRLRQAQGESHQGSYEKFICTRPPRSSNTRVSLTLKQVMVVEDWRCFH